MKIRLFEGSVGDSAAASTHQVQEGQSIVFLTPSVLNPVLCARFYDSDGVVHQVPAAQIVSIEPDSDLRLPVRYLDPETGKEVAALRADVDRMKADTGRLGPPPETQEDVDRRTQRLVDHIITQSAANAVPPVDRSKLCTTNQKPVEEVRASQTNETGQHEGYIVLCPDERAKGFVRPYRDRYQHVGRSVCGRLVRDVVHTDRLGGVRRICDEPSGHDGECGTVTRIVTQPEHAEIERTHLLGGCGTVTTMGRALSETYARDPKFYGATFCCGCNRHLPVAEFVWTADGQEVGS